MKHFRQHPDWQFIDTSIERLPDPRVSIAVLSDWHPVASDKRQSHGVEPDNYNFAVFDTEPHDLKFIQNSAFYKPQHRGLQGWFSVYVAEEQLQAVLFNRAMLKIQPRAVWRYRRAKPIRPLNPLLQQEIKSINKHIMTTEERLWQLGYYEKLRNKYFDGDERFIKVVGEPRGFVLNSSHNYDENGDSDYLEES